MAILFRPPSAKSTSVLCRPAFKSAYSAIVSSIVLAALIPAPLILQNVVPVLGSKIYKSVPANYSNYHFIGETIERGESFDVLVVGASDGATAIDIEVLKVRLSEELERPIRAVNLSTSWAGEDRHHQVLQDFYREGGRANLVLGFENDAIQTLPHELAKYWWRGNGWTFGLPITTRLQYGAMSLIGLPRQTWARLQAEPGPQPLAGYADRFDTIRAAHGYQPELHGFRSFVFPDLPQREIVERAFDVPQRDPSELFFPNLDEDSFTWLYYGYSELYSHFQKRTNSLVKENGGTYATIAVPTHFKDAALEKVIIRQLYDEEPRDWSIISISQTDLFKELDFEDMRNFYSNESHLNYVGAIHFTNSIAPAIARLLNEKSGTY